jgi:hypothetical protein
MHWDLHFEHWDLRFKLRFKLLWDLRFKLRFKLLWDLHWDVRFKLQLQWSQQLALQVLYTRPR